MAWAAVRATLGDYPRLAKETARRIPHVRLVEFPDLGHAPQLQAPEVFHRALLQWLEDTPSSLANPARGAKVAGRKLSGE